MEPYPGWPGLTVSGGLIPHGRRFTLKTVADVAQMQEDLAVIKELERLKRPALPTVGQKAG